MGVSEGIIDSSLGVDGLEYGRPYLLGSLRKQRAALRTEMKLSGWKDEQGIEPIFRSTCHSVVSKCIHRKELEYAIPIG